MISLFCSCNRKDLSNNTDNKKVSVDSKPEIIEDSVYAIIMVGDIMMGTNYPTSHSLPPDDGEHLFDEVMEFLQSADVTIGNLEGTLLNKGGTPKKCRDEFSNCVSFRMPEHYAGYLSIAGFDIMSLANNHSGDMGDIGRTSTVKTLESYSLHYAG